MKSSSNWLRSLPPDLARRVLAQEMQKRQLVAQKQQRLQELVYRRRLQLDEDGSLSEAPPAAVKISTENSLLYKESHPFYCLLHRKARYKVFWGGRGSGKSWAVAEALIRLADEKRVRVLCAREFQVSIKDSSHKILKDMIWRLGLQDRFKVTKEGISHLVTGAEFIFKGLHNNEHGIRSMEGIDICWLEEAQTVGASSWRSLIPTVFRKQDESGSNTSEIWVTYNLINEEDATHHRFVMTDRSGYSDYIVEKVNYDQNPYFPEGLRLEMEDDKKLDYHLYEHIWLGYPLKISNRIIYGGKYRVEEFSDQLWKEADRLYFGMDFGFAQDPNALERFFIHENKLYVEYEAYATGVDLDDLPDFMDRVPGSREWPIKADCARPETISYLRRRGFNISAAEKWDGCVKDGIQHIRKFDAIIIHPRCAGIAKEAPMYRYKEDPHQVDERGQPMVLPVIIDRFNHAWDGIRYGLDGHIQRCGEVGMWERLGQ